MVSNWEMSYLKNLNCDNEITDNGTGEYTVRGYETDIADSSTIIYWAANPPTYNGSFTGSGIPFPNPEIAYEKTINKGSVKTTGGHYEFKIRYPNAYYVDLGNKYVEPCVHIKICQPNANDKIKTIKLGNSIPFRSGTHPDGQRTSQNRNSSLFYGGRDNLPIRTQEQILRDTGYPDNNKMPDNFWGNAVPHP